VVRFEVDFLGCKVSYADAQEIRERLLADGHADAGGDEAEVAVISTCCVTNEALAKSRKAAARAARRHERVYVTGCASSSRATWARSAASASTRGSSACGHS
jgi:tRNA A37 methylthiotransferase MiaB